jgi:hypothetical protein
VLLTTFSDPLAVALERRLKILVDDTAAVVPRIRIASFLGIASELYELIHGRQPAIASANLVKALLTKGAATAGDPPIPQRFLMSEWANVVDAWQAASAQEYATAPRLARKSRMGNKQRDRLWPVIDSVRRQLAQRGLMTEAGVFCAVAEHYQGNEAKPFARPPRASPTLARRIMLRWSLSSRVFQRPASRQAGSFDPQSDLVRHHNLSVLANCYPLFRLPPACRAGSALARPR